MSTEQTIVSKIATVKGLRNSINGNRRFKLTLADQGRQIETKQDSTVSDYLQNYMSHYGDRFPSIVWRLTIVRNRVTEIVEN